MLITGLPPDSALHRRGGTGWQLEHELIALIVEKVEQRLSTLLVMWADDKSKRKIDPPIMVTHPDRPVVKDSRPTKRRVQPGDIQRLFG